MIHCGKERCSAYIAEAIAAGPPPRAGFHLPEQSAVAEDLESPWRAVVTRRGTKAAGGSRLGCAGCRGGVGLRLACNAQFGWLRHGPTHAAVCGGKDIPPMSQSNSDALNSRILTIRGQRVILDADLAKLYGVSTKRFNEAFKRNRRRFPADFTFQLSAQEFTALRSQFATLKPADAAGSMWSQIATTSKARGRGQHRKYLPWAFTEHGAVMAANVLRSPKAVEMSVYVVRAFIMQREALATNATILKRLAEIDRTLLQHDSALRALWQKLQPLLQPPPASPRRRIGFHAGNR